MVARSRTFRLAVTVCLLAVAWPSAALADSKEEAAKHFAKGEALYNQGAYQEAIAAFAEAQRLAPHAATLFNIARSHQNLGDLAKALEYYDRALESAKEDSLRCNIVQRAMRIRQQPTTVLVSTEPTGALVPASSAACRVAKHPVRTASLPPPRTATEQARARPWRHRTAAATRAPASFAATRAKRTRTAPRVTDAKRAAAASCPMSTSARTTSHCAGHRAL